MGGNSDRASLTSVTPVRLGIGPAGSIDVLSLGAGYDMLTLGQGASTVSYALGGAGGVEEIAGFNAARDLLSVALHGATLEQTLVGGGDWITSTLDTTRGVFLSGVTTVQATSTLGGVTTVA